MTKVKTNSVIIIESEAYEQLLKDLTKANEEGVERAVQKILDDRGLDSAWLKKEPAMEMLGVKSKSKMQELRDNGEIVFSQRPGSRTILYERQSILSYPEKNRHDKFLNH